ncbi:MAG: lipase maturation factor family protein [Chthoniobacterales bacterium]
MKPRTDLRVANPPAKPLMLFDGNCHFCRRWIERWREATGDRVDYASSQEAAAQFPEIPAVEYEGAVQLIETDGHVYSGSAAVFRSLGKTRGGSGLAWCAEHVPGFAAASEVTYKIIARNRQFASLGTRLLWGDDVRRPTYFTTRQIFLRSLGVIYLIAFVSLWVQIDGLIGSGGISPVAEFLPAAHDQLGSRAASVLPTLCWLNASDGFLHLLCGTGVLCSLLIIAGLLPAVSLLVAYVCYLSLTIAGQMFLSFQWDILLLEAGFLAIFFAPWRWRLTSNNEPPVPGVALFLLKLLLFKLMFMSGVVKLTSGDPSWPDLTAMKYHYETQPLPTVLGWWAFQGPEWLKRAAILFTFVAELAAPFLIWTPRRLRLIGCAIFVLLQFGIGLTGNYAFFNLLTLVLCLLLVDDAVLGRSRSQSVAAYPLWQIQRWSCVALLILTLPVNAFLIFNAFKPASEWPSPLSAIYEPIEPFRIANGYGLFRVMTKTRPEIVIEGSADGIDWLPYKFKWKPGELDRAPRWVQPHQPRLDWQMWFAALGSARSQPWFYGLAQALLKNSPSVVHLLESNPFPDKPPRFLRAILYEYKFTSREERSATGNWWKREEKREYLRPLSLRDE